MTRPRHEPGQAASVHARPGAALVGRSAANAAAISRQVRWASDRAWMVSRMSMIRIDQYPGRGSGNSCRA